jgi:hypothetical protein
VTAVMSAGWRKKLEQFQGRRILWINTAALDVFLYHTSSLEILRHMAQKGHNLVLITTRSKKVVRLENPRTRIISIPLRFVPLLSAVMFAIGLFLSLPYYIIVLKPDFIIATPDISITSLMPSLLFSKIKKLKFVLDVRSTPVENVGFRGFQQKFWFRASILVARKLFDGMTTITSLMRKEICNTFKIRMFFYIKCSRATVILWVLKEFLHFNTFFIILIFRIPTSTFFINIIINSTII